MSVVLFFSCGKRGDARDEHQDPLRESWGQIQDITKFRRCRFVRAISGGDLFQGSEAFFCLLEHRWMMVWYMVGLQGWKKRQRVEKRFTRVQIHIPGIERLPI